MGARTAGTVADLEFTVGARESRAAAANAVWTPVQALAPCRHTQGTSQPPPGKPSGAEGERSLPGKRAGPSASVNTASVYRSHCEERRTVGRPGVEVTLVAMPPWPHVSRLLAPHHRAVQFNQADRLGYEQQLLLAADLAPVALPYF